MAQSHFSILFAQSADIHRAIQNVIAHGRSDGGAIDPAEVVRELIEHYPDLTMPPAALLEEVVRAAAEAGVSLKVRQPE